LDAEHCQTTAMRFGSFYYRDKEPLEVTIQWLLPYL